MGESLAMIVLLAGVFSLSRSPLVISVKAEGEEDVHMLGARQRSLTAGSDVNGTAEPAAVEPAEVENAPNDPRGSLGGESSAARERR